MAYLTIARFGGDPDELLGDYRRSASLMDGVGRDHGLILHAAARTGDGMLLLNLWPSRDGSESAALDPRRLAALRDLGLEPESQWREHHVLERYVLFR